MTQIKQQLKRKNKTTPISLRVPNAMLDDIGIILTNFPSFTMTDIVLVGTQNLINRYKKLING